MLLVDLLGYWSMIYLIFLALKWAKLSEALYSSLRRIGMEAWGLAEFKRLTIFTFSLSILNTSIFLLYKLDFMIALSFSQSFSKLRSDFASSLNFLMESGYSEGL